MSIVIIALIIIGIIIGFMEGFSKDGIGLGILYGFIGGLVGTMASMIISLFILLFSSTAATEPVLVDTISLAQIETDNPEVVCYLATIREENYGKIKYYYFVEKDNISSFESDYYSEKDIKYLTDNSNGYIEVYENRFTNDFLNWFWENKPESIDKILYIPKDSVVKTGLPEYIKLVE